MMPQTLNYAAPGTARPMRGLLHTASVCALLPLTTGLTIMTLWLATGWRVWMGMGLLTIVGGLVLSIAGVLCLRVYRWQVARARLAPTWRLSKHEWLIAILLLANLPAAAMCVVVADRLMSRYTVVVINDTDDPVTQFTLDGPVMGNRTLGLNTIPPHSTSQRLVVRVRGEGDLVFTASHRGRAVEGTVAGYLSPPLSGPREGATVRFRDNAQPVVEERH